MPMVCVFVVYVCVYNGVVCVVCVCIMVWSVCVCIMVWSVCIMV